MAKKFNIHDWQAKQTQKRLDELQIKKVVDQSMSNDDIGALMNIVRNYDLGKVLNTLAVIIDRTGGMPEVAQKIADLVPGVVPDEDKEIGEVSATGTGASVSAGSGEGYATPKAFKKKRNNN
jgi:hypothetical protein